MNGNPETTSNSTKFAPMPMSALLAHLMPLQSQEDSPDCSFSSEDESNNSFADTVSKKPPMPKINAKYSKPSDKATHNVKSTATRDSVLFSEKKPNRNDHNDKENNIEHRIPNQIQSNQDNVVRSALKGFPNPSYPHSEIKKCSVLMSHNENASLHNPDVKKTPEMIKIPSSSQKVKSATPKIKSGIRRFTPGSARKSQKKTPQKALIQTNREKVRCELFSQNQDSFQEPSVPCSETPQAPIPQTPMNRQPMPASYVATPSYPQGVLGNSSKILFKITHIKNKKYMFIKKLGTGGSSEVYKVLEVGTSCEYAVKCVNLATDPELARGYINEVRLLRELQNSDRVIRLFNYEYDRNNQFLRMVLEVGETDLSSFLKARGAGLSPALLLHFWEEMLQSVNYIHEHGVIHADLKPANFLLVLGRLKLIDFGIASAVAGDATSVVRAQAAGTYSYISPEALMGGAGGYAGDHSAPIKISFRSDVWSLGCILYSMMYGRTPFGHIPNLAKLAAILDPNHRIDYPPLNHLPASLMSSLKWCLTYNVRERPSVSELLSVRHLQPPRELPPALMNKLRDLLTPEELQQLL